MQSSSHLNVLMAAEIAHQQHACLKRFQDHLHVIVEVGRKVAAAAAKIVSQKPTIFTCTSLMRIQIVLTAHLSCRSEWEQLL